MIDMEFEYELQHPFYPEVYVPSWEVWKDVPGWEGYYQVSNWGGVKSLPRFVPRKSKSGKYFPMKVNGRIMNLTPLGDREKDYLFVGFKRGNKGYNELVHRLVLQTFVSPAPEKMECSHWDGDPTNNRVENLRWATKSENEKDKARHGTQMACVSHPKLTMKQAREIRKFYAEGKGSTYVLAETYSVSSPCIQQILRGETYVEQA